MMLTLIFHLFITAVTEWSPAAVFSHLERNRCYERQSESNGQVKPQTLPQQPPHHRLWQRHGG